jgi:hypothetical protein
MQSLSLTIERQQTEWNTIKTMAQNNNFPGNLITNLEVQMKQQKVHQSQNKDENKKRATFTYLLTYLLHGAESFLPSRTTVQKLENSPTSSNIPTYTLHSKTQYSNIQNQRPSIKIRTTT